jgi:translation initiation factor 6
MAIFRSSNFGNPHVGLFAKASDKLAVLDASCSPKFFSAVSQALGVPVAKTTIGGSSFAGLFMAMNSNGAVVPSFCSKEEISALKSHGLNVCTISGKFSAAGNNIAANDFAAVANPEMQSSERKKISDCLGVEVVERHVAGFATAGSCLLATNKGFAAHNRATEEELKELQSILRVAGQNCTVNTGVAFVSLGAMATSKGALVGESCTGFEAGRLATALGLA